MDTVFGKQQIESFVQDLNSAKPMPGGGSAAAICGAMGAALAGMSAHMTVGKKKYAAVENRMQEIITETGNLQAEMLDMAKEDADMYILVLSMFIVNPFPLFWYCRPINYRTQQRKKRKPGDRPLKRPAGQQSLLR